jgi:hypothetical protein
VSDYNAQVAFIIYGFVASGALGGLIVWGLKAVAARSGEVQVRRQPFRVPKPAQGRLVRLRAVPLDEDTDEAQAAQTGETRRVEGE